MPGSDTCGERFESQYFTRRFVAATGWGATEVIGSQPVTNPWDNWGILRLAMNPSGRAVAAWTGWYFQGGDGPWVVVRAFR